MKKLLNLFYRLPLGWLFLGACVTAFCFRAAWSRWGTRPWFRAVCILTLAFWIYVLAQLTLLNKPLGCETRFHLVPLHFLWEMLTTHNNELFRTMFMNAILFFPAGLLVSALLPRSWPRRRAVSAVCLLFLGTSAAIECCQFILQIGLAEVDDLLFNGLGAYLGTLVIWPKLPRK